MADIAERITGFGQFHRGLLRGCIEDLGQSTSILVRTCCRSGRGFGNNQGAEKIGIDMMPRFDEIQRAEIIDQVAVLRKTLAKRFANLHLLVLIYKMLQSTSRMYACRLQKEQANYD
mgnify:CR=1 FL=1